MSTEESTRPKGKRERSARYPGVPLSDSVELCRFIDEHGLDGLTAGDIATALGFKSIKTNTFSARLSSARQFGLLSLRDEGYTLTSLAKGLLHPVDPAETSKLLRQALLEPPIYAELAQRLADKKVPEASILANVLYHNFSIIATAKQQAAEAFLDSARFAGSLAADGVFRPHGIPEPEPAPAPTVPAARARPERPERPPGSASSAVRLDLRLWGEDDGKMLRLRAPESITPASFERFLQAFRLHVRVEEPPTES